MDQDSDREHNFHFEEERNDSELELFSDEENLGDENSNHADPYMLSGEEFIELEVGEDFFGSIIGSEDDLDDDDLDDLEAEEDANYFNPDEGDGIWYDDYDEDEEDFDLGLIPTLLAASSGRRRINDSELEKVDENYNEFSKKQKNEFGDTLNDSNLIQTEDIYRFNGISLETLPYISQRILFCKGAGAYNVSKLCMTKDFIPNSRGRIIKQFSKRVYSGQFSEDGSFFYSCSQDFKMRLFSSDKEKLNEVKVVRADMGQWTLTDSTLSRDNKWLAYASITPVAYMTKTDPMDNEQSRLCFSGDYEDKFGIWSLRFSSDGKEMVAGTTSHSIMILDIESGTVVFNQKGHQDDVNAVCFADPTSHVMFSGSDDSLIKVWDRRSMYGNECNPAGTLVGHTSGLTFVSSKGDGRYCISNSKDQSMKLWDIRKLVSVDKFDLTTHTDISINYDYRSDYYPYNSPLVHPNDVSVMTYKGHLVQNTLIRCHFSPIITTGQSYLYTGSADGKIHIYNLDGTIAQVLNTNLSKLDNDEGILNKHSDDGQTQVDEDIALRNSNQIHSLSFLMGRQSHITFSRLQNRNTKRIVRDVAWHPTQTYLIASCFENDMGKLTKHRFTTSCI